MDSFVCVDLIIKTKAANGVTGIQTKKGFSKKNHPNRSSVILLMLFNVVVV